MEDIETANILLKKYSLNSCTVDGKQTRKGKLVGGHRIFENSPSYLLLKEKIKKNQTKKEKKQIEEKISFLSQKIEEKNIFDQIQKNEKKILNFEEQKKSFSEQLKNFISTKNDFQINVEIHKKNLKENLKSLKENKKENEKIYLENQINLDEMKKKFEKFEKENKNNKNKNSENKNSEKIEKIDLNILKLNLHSKNEEKIEINKILENLNVENQNLNNTLLSLTKTIGSLKNKQKENSEKIQQKFFLKIDENFAEKMNEIDENFSIENIEIEKKNISLQFELKKQKLSQIEKKIKKLGNFFESNERLLFQNKKENLKLLKNHLEIIDNRYYNLI